ncbi:hypothetical protein ACEWY4_024751 [Coilia grayii]|uniref:Ig-like domain-containing protein n=1 Tax=Coilia grayii TaxID=363190 RepID=A0ABD1IVM0_9TELE
MWRHCEWACCRGSERRSFLPVTPQSPPIVRLATDAMATHQSPPKFLRTPNDQIGVQGGVASFICQATGDPRPKIVWNKKGKRVSNQRFEVIDFDDGSGSVLRIQPLRTPRDEAIYECVASNSVGETSATTRLTVLRAHREVCMCRES